MVGSTRRLNAGVDNSKKIRWAIICLCVFSVVAVVWYLLPSNDAGPRKSKAGAEFGDIWDTRMGADTEENTENNPAVEQPTAPEGQQEIAGDREAALKKIMGRRTLLKIDEWDFGDLPEKNWQPLDLSTDVSSLSIPFVIAEYRNDTSTIPTQPSATTVAQSLPPIRLVLPWWHPDAFKAITTGSSLPISNELLHYNSLITNLLLEYYPPETPNNTLPNRAPLVVDIGSCFGHLPLVAATKGLKSIVYQPVVVNAEKIRLSVAFNGFEELITIFEAAALDEIGDLEMAFPLEPKRSCEASISLTNLQLEQKVESERTEPQEKSEETVGEKSMVWLDVQMVRADYSVEWVNLMDDILLLHISSMGFEYQAIKGSLNLFKTSRVHNVIHEFWPFGIFHSGIEPIALLLYMDELGFRLKHLPVMTDAPYQTDREFKRLANLYDEKITLHWIRK